MKTSQFNGRQVSYTDPIKLHHNGVVVGQSDDGKWQFVQSTNPKVPPSDWHFKVSTDMIDTVLVSA